MIDNEVSSAFEILLEEVETIIEELNQEGAHNFSISKHQEARSLLDKAEAVNKFRARVKELQKEWQSLETQTKRVSPLEHKHHKKIVKSRLQRGLRTPEAEFYRPIMEILVRLGGKAPATDVLNMIPRWMEGVLNEYDMQYLTSVPNTPRWRNTTQWARNELINEGLLSKVSPKGIWEITDKGKSELEKWQGAQEEVKPGIIFPLTIKANYKGKIYTGELLDLDGNARYNGVEYSTPSGAAMSISSGQVNGWRFWKYRNPETGNWEEISNLRDA